MSYEGNQGFPFWERELAPTLSTKSSEQGWGTCAGPPVTIAHTQRRKQEGKGQRGVAGCPARLLLQGNIRILTADDPFPDHDAEWGKAHIRNALASIDLLVMYLGT